MKQFFHRKKNTYYLFSVLVILFIFLLISVSMFAFGKVVQEKELKESQKELGNTSERAAKAIQVHLNDSVVILKNLSLFLSTESFPNEELEQNMLQISQNTGFSLIGIADINGQTHLSDGTTDNIGGHPFLLQALQGNVWISDIMTKEQNSNPFFIISVPHYRQEGEVDGIVYGVYEADILSSLLESSYSSNSGYIHIFDSEGKMILNSVNENALFQQNTIWENLNLATVPNQNQLEEMKQNVQNGKTGFISYGDKQFRRYAYYMPIGINDWYTLTAVKQDDIYQHVNHLQTMMIDLTLKIILAFVIIILIIIFIVRSNWKRLEKINQDLTVTEETFRIVTSHTLNLIFNYDAKTNLITIFNAGQYNKLFPAGSSYSPCYFLEQGLIQADSANSWKNVFSRIVSGEKSSCEIIHTQFHPQKSGWGKLTLSNIFNQEETAIRSVGILEDITEQYEKELLYLQEQKYREILMAESSHTYEINLTQNLIIKYYSNTELHGESCSVNFANMVDHFLNHIAHPQDRDYLEKLISPAALLTAYHQGKKHIKFDYRHKIGENIYAWMEYNLYFSKDLLSNNIMLNIIIRDIDQEKQEEFFLRNQARHDPLTQLYNRSTAISLINQTITNSQNTDHHAFMIIDLDNFKTLNDTLGHIEGDHVLQDVGEKIRSHFRSSDICARLGGDEFIVFMKDIGQTDMAAQKAEELLELLHHTYSKDEKSVPISVSIGISLYPEHGTTVDMLYEAADKALYIVKKHQKNAYLLYSSAT